MNKYELALVFAPGLDEEGFRNAMEKVKELLERFGASILKIDEWGKRRLAYEINKINEGYYVFINFESEAGAPADIENRLRISEDIIRYLIIRIDE